MDVECTRHPGTSTIGIQLLDETATMAGKSWQPSHEPLRRREEGHLSHGYDIHSGNKEGRGGDNPETTLKGRRALQQTHEGSTCMWTREGCKLHGVTNASSKHALVQVHEQTQQNARE